METGPGMPRGWKKVAELEYRTVCDGVVYVLVKGFSRKYEAWFRGERLGQTPTKLIAPVSTGAFGNFNDGGEDVTLCRRLDKVSLW